MTRGKTGEKPLWLLISHVAVAVVLAIGTLWPYEFTSVLPTAFQFNNWPPGFKIATGLAAAACIIGDIWLFVVRPGLATPRADGDAGGSA